MKIKIGVFGAGRGISMIKAYLTHPEAELVAICDKYVPLLEKAKKISDECEVSVALYESFDDFIKHDMDAVVLANYAIEHAPFAIRCLEAGKHVLSEVTACETMAQAVELIEAVERTGLVYAYAENCCYMESAFEMWRLYENGELREVMFAEGEYIHDSTTIHPQITYGDPNHWRNRSYSTFYCTHSIGPILTITGLRPVQVVGLETNYKLYSEPMQYYGRAGIEMLTLENGAIVRSIHGPLKREPAGCKWMLYGHKGMAETDRFDNKKIHVYREGDEACVGEFKSYVPDFKEFTSVSEKNLGHGICDIGAPHYFIQKILGTPEGEKYSIDVYTAVDMSICGILAFRSIWNGNIPVEIPNLRNLGERDAYRNDNACTNPAVAGDQILGKSPNPYPEKDTETYEFIRKLWEEGKKGVK